MLKKGESIGVRGYPEFGLSPEIEVSSEIYDHLRHLKKSVHKLKVSSVERNKKGNKLKNPG